MSKQVVLKDMSYHVIGRSSLLREADAEIRFALLECYAATLVKSDFVILGEKPSEKKLDKARQRGILVISQAEALEALENDGVVELASSDISAIIGEVRSLFARDGESDSDKWLGCAEILDRCDPEQLEPVLEYVESVLERQLDAKARWTPTRPKHRLMEGVNSKWLLGNARDELFVAPPAWVHEMSAGSYSLKHRLVRALNLDHFNLTQRQLRKLLKNPHLRGVRFLNFGRRCRFPESILEELDEFPGLALEELWLYHFKDTITGLLITNKTALQRVRTIAFHGCLLHYNDADHFGSLSAEEGAQVIQDLKDAECFGSAPEIKFESVSGR